MSEYYMGMAVGGAIGYALGLITLIGIWVLCIIAKNEALNKHE